MIRNLYYYSSDMVKNKSSEETPFIIKMLLINNINKIYSLQVNHSIFPLKEEI